jgi:hypothetical protein
MAAYQSYNICQTRHCSAATTSDMLTFLSYHPFYLAVHILTFTWKTAAAPGYAKTNTNLSGWLHYFSQQAGSNATHK